MGSFDKGRDILIRLMEKGVRVPCPESVEIGEDISPERVSGDNVVIHSGCKIYGRETLIMPGARLGYETPVTINNCQIGRDVDLKGGFFEGSAFLAGSSMGSGAQVREGCLLEEGARGAHSVGLKQTILFPYVTLGSLINFCDCLMAGGTDEKNHSEVGSSYIHFNYTPNQDKATASLMGDVPRGVMVNQPPVFLGGQGGIVGPVILEYGTVIAAGTIVRKDILKENSMLLGSPSIPSVVPFQRGAYHNLKRIISLNLNYIANLVALRRWYLDIRFMFTGSEKMEKMLFQGAVDKLDSAIKERVRQLGKVAEKAHLTRLTDGEMKAIDILKEAFFRRWQELEGRIREALSAEGDPVKRAGFVETINQAINRHGKDYITVIKKLNGQESSAGTAWLQGIVANVSGRAFALLPGMEDK
jgi:bifunctional UDP-N-acetylglucosamine pyrophosphorylase / glucosamine-1-phosphate N-acetyltransferase